MGYAQSASKRSCAGIQRLQVGLLDWLPGRLMVVRTVTGPPYHAAALAPRHAGRCARSPATPVRGVHDLHRRRARRRLHRPHIRHPATLRPRISAPTQLPRTKNMQVTALSLSRIQNREPTQVPERARRRRFPAQYKLDVLDAHDAAGQGEKGAILRREALYSSQIVDWRRARDPRGADGPARPR